MHTKYEVFISCASKAIARVKVDNIQTDRQTNTQDKNNMPPIIRSGEKSYDPAAGNDAARTCTSF